MVYLCTTYLILNSKDLLVTAIKENLLEDYVDMMITQGYLS
jgi:hypothetical protein